MLQMQVIGIAGALLVVLTGLVVLAVKVTEREGKKG